MGAATPRQTQPADRRGQRLSDGACSWDNRRVRLLAPRDRGPQPTRVSIDAAAPPPGDVTEHLLAARAGDRAAFDSLFEVVYDRLRSLARARASGARLAATELVHEAYLKFVDASRATWNDRQHFFAVAARAMRQIVVDHLRRQGAAKRGGGLALTSLGDHHGAIEVPADQVLAVDEALARLGDTSPRLVQVVEACFFMGLTTEEAGDALGLSARTVKREWQKAKMLLGVILAPPAS